MSAWPEPRRTGLLAAALARAEAWLLEPPLPRAAAPGPPPAAPRPVVAVRGLARGCGASTVARALAASLARRDPTGAAVVIGGPSGAGPRLAVPAALGLARTLAAAGCEGPRASGRVCLVADAQPLEVAVRAADTPIVIDVGHASPPAEGLGHADLVVLVASPRVEEALVVAVETSLAAADHRGQVVLNRVEPEDLAAPGADLPTNDPLVIAESRIAAQLALACREPRGPFATPIAALAERCRAAAQ
jgi:hypothetical protein